MAADRRPPAAGPSSQVSRRADTLRGSHGMDSVGAVAQSLYLASLDPGSGKSAVAVGVMDLLTRRAGSVAVFRPIVRDEHAHPSPSARTGLKTDPALQGDPIIDLLRGQYRLPCRKGRLR